MRRRQIDGEGGGDMRRKNKEEGPVYTIFG